MDISCKSRNCENCILKDYMGTNSIGIKLYGCKNISSCNNKNGLSILKEIEITRKKNDLK